MYFNKFPLIQYDIKKDKSKKLATDILARIAFREKLTSHLDAFQRYDVQESQTPEMVALDVYGDESYHWIVLLFNEIIDPYFDFPMSDTQVEDFLNKKYPNEAIYCGDTPYNFIVGERIFWKTIEAGSNYDSVGLVGSWDATTKKLEIYSKTEPIDLTHANTGKISIKSKNKDGVDFTTPITRMVDIHQLGLHHFENNGGTAELNPYGTPPDSNGIQTVIGHTGPTGGSYGDTAATFGNTIIHAYLNSNDGSVTTYSTVTIKEDFISKNDKKRNIKILLPKYVGEVVDEFNKLMIGA